MHAMRKLSIILALLAVVTAVAILARGAFERTPSPPPEPRPIAEAPATNDVLVPEHGPVGREATPTSPAEEVAEPTRGDTSAERPSKPSPSGSVEPSPPMEEPPGTGEAVGDARRILARASDAYGEVRALSAEFVQRVENPLLGRTTVSRGTLAQRRPDRFLMDFSEPAGDRIVSDGEHLWVYYPSVDPDQVMRFPAETGAGGVDLQAQFLGDPLQRFEAELRGEESVDGRPADILVLDPRVSTGYRRLVLWVDRRDGLARRFEIVEENGTRRRFDLTRLRTGVALPDEMFRFTPPAGARVVDRG